jgi:D-amino-acid dehydrogenase
MQVAVIGGGVIGVSTAYFLAAAGHEVVVIERYGNVAQETSFGAAGVVAPGYVTPWAAPGMPKKILSYLFKSESPVLLKPAMNRELWRWGRMWLKECELERYKTNRTRMQRVASYSREILQKLREHYELDYEQTTGVLQLFRSQRDVELAQPAIDLLAENGLVHRMVEPDEARRIEPGLSAHTPLAAALHLSQDESGNCPLFTRKLKQIAESLGVNFHFNSTVRAIASEGRRVSMHIDERTFSADAVVIAAGFDSVQLLEPLGISIPLYPVKGYSATAFIKNFELAPLSALIDEAYKVAITRMGSRVRIAGIADLSSRGPDLRDAAIRTLVKVGDEWFPNAANYHNATYWCGLRPTLPDAAPLLGATRIDNVFINIGHGSAGWAMAAGSGKILSDLVSGRSPDIDMAGLTLARYG